MCVPNKTYDLKSKRFYHDYRNKWIKSKFDGRKCSSNRKLNNYKCWCECKNRKEHNICKKVYIWNPDACSHKCGNDFANVIDD